MLNKTCQNHSWPRAGANSLTRSIGSASYEHCNNCLAMRIVFETYTQVDGQWVALKNTQIIEPAFVQE